MIKKIKQLAIIIAMLALVLPTAMIAESNDAPEITIFVFGEVKIDGITASCGTVSVAGVTAAIGNDGKYSVEILSNDVEKEEYKVNSIIATKEFGEFTSTWAKINLSIILASEYSLIADSMHSFILI